jgi:hypothetical protein
MIRKQSFHHIAYLLAMLMMMLSVQSCSTMGYENVDTTRKAILVANAEVRAANLLLSDLVDRRAIDRDDARSALNSLQDAKDHLQTALSAVDVAGDPVTAGSSLERANAAISVVMVLLAPLVET